MDIASSRGPLPFKLVVHRSRTERRARELKHHSSWTLRGSVTSLGLALALRMKWSSPKPRVERVHPFQASQFLASHRL
eukprot:7508694-Lingulodinium_polyedra.AAC.1